MRSPRQRLLPPLLVSAVLFAALFLLIGIRPSDEARAQTVPPTPTPTATPRHRPKPPPATPAPRPRPTAEPEEEREDEGPARPSQSSVSSMLIPAMPMSMQPTTVTVGGADDPAAVNRFLRALLAGFGPPGGVLTVTIGALPVDLPITLSLPAEVNVIGGYVRSGEYEESLLLLSGGETPEALADLVRQSFVTMGYTATAESVAAMGGQVFLPNDPQSPDILCSPDRRYIVFQGFSNLAGEPAVLRVSINRSSAGDICSPTPYGADNMTADLLPPLAPPPGAQVRSTGMGSGGNTVSATAEIGTSMPVAELAAHYAAQLAAAGWEQLDSSSADAIEWSAWRLSDTQGNAWTATFTIVQKGDNPNLFMLNLQADLQP